MKSQLAQWSVANANGDYATCEDFCQLFERNAKSFYLLSLLLTADPEEAEQCFVAGLDDCVDGISMFQRSIDSWARRVIVGRAVRLIHPCPGDPAQRMRALHRADQESVRGFALQENPFAMAFVLRDFERIVFVPSVLEDYPDQICAIFLGTSRLEVQKARGRAFVHIAGVCSSHATSLS